MQAIDQSASATRFARGVLAAVAATAIAGAALMCRLSAYQEPFSPAKLRALYRTKGAYIRQLERRLAELEKQGWSLPVYRQMILADAAAVQF